MVVKKREAISFYPPVFERHKTLFVTSSTDWHKKKSRPPYLDREQVKKTVSVLIHPSIT